MAYVELFGLPGSGKSALLAEVRRSLGKHSHQITACSARSSFQSYSAWVKKEVVNRPQSRRNAQRLRALSPLHWNDGILAQHPELFSVITSHWSKLDFRQPQVQGALTFFRSRLSDFHLVYRQNKYQVVVTDEGLTQAIFSYCVRLPQAPPPALLDSLVASLPTQRVVIFVNTPLEETVSRIAASRPQASRFSTEENRILIDNIWATTRQIAVHSFEVDGLASLERNVEVIINKLTAAQFS